MDNDSAVLANSTEPEKGISEEEAMPSDAGAVPDEEKTVTPSALPGTGAPAPGSAENANAADVEENQQPREEMQSAAAEAPRVEKAHSGLIMYVASAILVAIILYGFYNQLQYVAVSPNSLPQAGNARFYENFIYKDAHLIPSSCTVFSYDPTLFNINNRTAAQLGYLYDKQEYTALIKNNSCMVIDYGYWCYTPNNICTYAKSDFILSTIANATYNQTNETFSLYRVVGINTSS